jgi:deoxyadenosine/deoxycytidine kinase
MTDEDKKLISDFETKLRHLIYVNDELQRRNKELEKRLEAEKQAQTELSAEYESLKVDYTNIKMAAAISLNNSDVRETKLRLDRIVREIDQCIAQLE